MKSLILRSMAGAAILASLTACGGSGGSADGKPAGSDHFYTKADGDAYTYLQVASAADKANGNTDQPHVFHYIGNEGGEYAVAMDQPDGGFRVTTCKLNCTKYLQLSTTDGIDRTPVETDFDKTGMAEQALQDAWTGKLQESKATAEAFAKANAARFQAAGALPKP